MAVKKGVKKKDHENLSDANIEKVIGLLEVEKPITKKEACEILNITYNTTRLANIIQEYRDKLETEKKLRAANRGREFDEYEVRDAIESFLMGESLKEISDRMFRSTASVKRVIEQAGVPQRKAGHNYFDFEPHPEQCSADTFEPDEYVWSDRHGAIAQVIKLVGKASDGTNANVYQIYVLETIDPEKMKIDGKHYDSHLSANGQLRTMGGFYASQRAYELASLKHLVEKHKINVRKAIK